MRIPISLLALLLTGLWGATVLAQDEFTELDAAYTGMPMPKLTRAGNWHGLVGGAVMVLQQPIADKRSFVLPLVAVTYRNTVYWHFGQLGVYVVNSNDHRARLALAVKARRGYDPADYTALAGMDKRYTSAEAGLHGTWFTHANFVSYGVFTDISGHSHGNSVQLSLAHPFRLAPRWFLTPSVGAEWLSAKVVDYYYGVQASEATASRPAYTGTASTNLRVGVMLSHRLSRSWSLFGGMGVTYLGSGISNSPIVVHDNISAVHFGGAWHF